MSNYQWFYSLFVVIGLLMTIYLNLDMRRWLPIAKIALHITPERERILKEYWLLSVTKALFMASFYAYVLSCLLLLLNSFGLYTIHIYLSVVLAGLYLCYIVLAHSIFYPLSQSTRAYDEYCARSATR